MRLADEIQSLWHACEGTSREHPCDRDRESASVAHHAAAIILPPLHRSCSLLRLRRRGHIRSSRGRRMIIDVSRCPCSSRVCGVFSPHARRRVGLKLTLALNEVFMAGPRSSHTAGHSRTHVRARGIGVPCPARGRPRFVVYGDSNFVRTREDEASLSCRAAARATRHSTVQCIPSPRASPS